LQIRYALSQQLIVYYGRMRFLKGTLLEAGGDVEEEGTLVLI
jgi:hypothetical protein